MALHERRDLAQDHLSGAQHGIGVEGIEAAAKAAALCTRCISAPGAGPAFSPVVSRCAWRAHQKAPLPKSPSGASAQERRDWGDGKSNGARPLEELRLSHRPIGVVGVLNETPTNGRRMRGGQEMGGRS
jgi:hypothetical protein